MLRRADRSDSEEPGLRMRMLRDFRRLHEQHRQLHRLLEIVREGLADPSGVELSRAFARFRDGLESHISIEDDVYFPALHGLAPQLEGELTILIEEHRGLRERLARLHDALASGQREQFCADLEIFAAEHTSHEAHEEEVYAAAARPGEEA